MDFARLVLRYSTVHGDGHVKYLDRVKERAEPDDKVISNFISVCSLV